MYIDRSRNTLTLTLDVLSPRYLPARDDEYSTQIAPKSSLNIKRCHNQLTHEVYLLAVKYGVSRIGRATFILEDTNHHLAPCAMPKRASRLPKTWCECDKDGFFLHNLMSLSSYIIPKLINHYLVSTDPSLNFAPDVS